MEPYISLKLNKKAKNFLITSIDEIRSLNNITINFLKKSLGMSDQAIDFLTLNSPDEELIKEILTGNKIELFQCKLPARKKI